MSNDWDEPDHSYLALPLQEVLHTDYPELKMTHFEGPYTFTDPETEPAHVEVLMDRVRW